MESNETPEDAIFSTELPKGVSNVSEMAIRWDECVNKEQVLLTSGTVVKGQTNRCGPYSNFRHKMLKALYCKIDFIDTVEELTSNLQGMQ